jgi:Zn-dependent protease
MSPIDVAADVELVRSMVAKYFPIYDVKVSYEAVALLVSPDKAMLETNFENLRKDMKAKGFIPLINYSGGEYTISVVRLPESKKRNQWVNRVLLIITFFTTTLAGMLLWADYNGTADFFTVDNFIMGALTFAIPLMAILGVHELSHYLMSKRHGLEASLPYFIPSIPPFGTFGAFISMRDPMPNRKALVDIGVAGPLGGLAVTIPVAIIGLFLTANGHTVDGPVGDGGVLAIMFQPLYQLLTMLVPIQDNMALHPTAFAAWVGFLVTAINLLPIGQLDGGHIARGLLGEKAKYLGYAAFGILVIMALLYDGWILFALLVFFMGIRHPAPLNDISKLNWRTAAVGILGMVVLVATFVPQPLVAISPDHSFDMGVIGSNNTTVAVGGIAEFHIFFNNTGNTIAS